MKTAEDHFDPGIAKPFGNLVGPFAVKRGYGDTDKIEGAIEGNFIGVFMDDTDLPFRRGESGQKIRRERNHEHLFGLDGFTIVPELCRCDEKQIHSELSLS